MVINIQSSRSKDSSTDIQQLLSLLDDMKAKDPQLRYAYEYDEGNTDIY
jgi:hypothetical protein